MSDPTDAFDGALPDAPSSEGSTEGSTAATDAPGAGWTDARVEGGTQFLPGPPSQARQEHLAKMRAGQKAHHEAMAAATAAGAVSRWVQFCRKEITFGDMDEEELSKGQFRDVAGGWMGGGVQRLTPKQRQDLKRELLGRGQERMDAMYIEMIDVLGKIGRSSVAKESDRIKAATLLMERVAGKVPDRVELGGSDAFSDVLAGIVDDSVSSRRKAGVQDEEDA